MPTNGELHEFYHQLGAEAVDALRKEGTDKVDPMVKLTAIAFLGFEMLAQAVTRSAPVATVGMSPKAVTGIAAVVGVIATAMQAAIRQWN